MDIYSRTARLQKTLVSFLPAVQGMCVALLVSAVSVDSYALTPTGGKTAVLSGDFSVSGGEATYSLPISVSPGRAGHQPSLSLEYRSDSPNGYLGMGWSIGGLSAISRCGRNLAVDERWGGVQFNDNDRYCLDGKRLIAITGKDGANLTEYRLKENGYSKIVSFNRQGNGPQYFKVWSKDGSVYEYGVTEDARAQLPGQDHVYKWALNKITDITGNNDIDFKYAEQQSGSSHKIVSVDYVGGKVLFTYRERNDKTSSYLYGSKLENSERITNLTIKNSNNQDISNYTVNYVYSPGTKRSLIDNIKYCSGSECATPISFDWYSKQNINHSVQHSDLIEPKYIDTNRDGRPSSYGIVSRTLVDHCNDYITYRIKHPNGSTVTGGHGSKYSLIGSLVDPTLITTKWQKIGTRCDGDTYGRANKAVLTPKGLCLGGSYSPNGDGNLNAYCENTHSAGDFNGDGKETLSSAYKLLYTGGKLRKVVAKSLDINGDGIDDLHYGVSLGKLRYKITGESTEKEVEVASPAGTHSYIQLSFLDINNDSLPDVVSYNPSNNQTRIYINTSHRFYLSQTFSVGSKESDSVKLDFIDINSDGYPEYFREGRFYENEFGLIQPNKTVETTINHTLSALLSSSSYISYPDINGDGWPDVVTTYSFSASNDVNLPSLVISGTHGEGSSHTSKPIDITQKAVEHLSDGGIQDKISNISEAGVDYSISYKFAADPSVHKQVLHHNYPYLNTTPRRFLVSGYSKSPKGYSPTTYSYVYEGARSHARGYGFLGFQKITRTENAAITTQIATTYEVDNGLTAGKPLSIVETRNGKKISEQTFNYTHTPRDGYNAKYHQVYASSVTTLAYDLALQKVKRREITERVIDRFGNLISESSDITSDIANGGHFVTSTANQYLSTGVNSAHQIYDITSIQNIDNFASTLAGFKAGLGRYCGTDGKIYFKPNDHIVLIHGEIDTPIVLQRYNHFYRYDTTGSSTDLDGLTTITGNLTGISAAVFNTASPNACGSYAFSDYDGDGQAEFATTKTTRTELVTESGANFWKIGALTVSKTTITDKSNSNLSRTVQNTFAYNGDGLLEANTTNASAYGSTGDSVTSGKYLTNAFEYDDYGNVTKTKVTGTGIAKARTSVTAYDSDGLYPKSQANAKGHTTKLTYNANGLMTRSVSPLAGRTMSYSYDAFQRLNTETRPGSNNTINHSYKLGSDCANATSQTVSCVRTDATDRGEVITHFDYAGREIRTLHQGFNGEWIVRDNTWDKSGRKVSATRPRFLSDSGVSVVNFQYDELHRETRKDEPAATSGQRAVFKTAYNGFVTELTDARAFKHSTTQNLLGHILRKDEPDGAYQTYNYYPDGKLKDTADSSGNVTRIEYDELGHRSKLSDPDMGDWTYTYNALGELKVKKDANNVKTTLTYDELGRKTREQYNTGGLMQWTYDTRGKLGTLASVQGNGLRSDYYYNEKGQLQEVAKQTGDEKFSSHYFYDAYERVTREVRPNGIDTSRLAGANILGEDDKPENRLVLEYVYNTNGYMSAVRSPKNYADDVFTSASFREEIRQLLNDAIELANTYLVRAERYATQESFFKNKAEEYKQKTVNVHTLDGSSAAMLAGGYRYKQWCNAQQVCYLRPGTWVLLHDDVVTPIDVTLDGDIYRIESDYQSTSAGKRNYAASVHKVTQAEFDSQALTAAHDFILTDYDRNGQPDLMSTKDIYIAQADSETQEELLFSAEDLDQAAVIAGTRYKFYTELATALISLSEDVAKFTGIYCEMANQLGGGLTTAQRSGCVDDKETSQAEQLSLILRNSELADASESDAYVYYWQRRETDAWDHTLSEMLGNGLANTYHHNANTGRPDFIATHKGSQLFNKNVSGYTKAGRNIRLIEYKYDNHDNVTYRYDQFLGIKDTFTYDGLDRVTSNNVVLDTPDRHLAGNPDFAGPFDVSYDKLGNIKSRTETGNYNYDNVAAGPHAVTSANGLTYQYDAVGNMVSAKTEEGSEGATLERELEWNAFNKPTKITRNGQTVEFTYDANHSRYLKKTSAGINTFYFDKTYERVTDTNTGDVQHKHFVYADGKLIALNTQTRDSQDKLKDKQIRYLHYDALQSVDMITDGYGVVVERRSYNVWGKQRKVIWQDDSPTHVEQAVITNRGYTGHEEIEEVGLIHMNGRVYDQELGRFISADPIVQAPFVTNSFNRYAYVWNNPLKYVDPTGYVLVQPAAQIRAMQIAFDNGYNHRDDVKVGGGAVSLTKEEAHLASALDDAVSSLSDSLSKAAVHAAKSTPAGFLADQITKALSESNTEDEVGDSVDPESEDQKGVEKTKEKEYGSYENLHESGTTYSGYGDRKRSQTSGKEKEKKYDDTHIGTHWTPADNHREAMKDEADRIEENGGKESDGNYNLINSPGKKYKEQDSIKSPGDKYKDTGNNNQSSSSESSNDESYGGR
ncbi:RHS repeat-associated core domain-containing protein [Enterovibrio norvegicus]|uniref:RHS repeat-associated core domain-containing protein n=1 Tax=Enterovibrio norvegicus TaxID=188144 RepID=UPI0024B0FF8E|nr:RHS repeat-associated core domain-containing protein [Enterovibrio norvegicus]